MPFILQVSMSDATTPIGRAHAGLLVRFARRAPAAVKLKPGGVIRPFCEPAIATVDAPGVHLERHAAKRGDGIDHQERAVAGGADRFRAAVMAVATDGDVGLGPVPAASITRSRSRNSRSCPSTHGAGSNGGKVRPSD